MTITSDISIISHLHWTSFIQNHPEGQTFLLPEMVSFYSSIPLQEPVTCFAIDDDNNICGILVAVIMKDFKGILGRFTSRSIVMGGPIVKDNDPSIAEALITEYLKQVSHKAIYSQFRNLYDMKWMDASMTKNHFKYEDHLDFIHDLTIDRETIISSVNKNKRANIRKSTNKGTEFIEINTQEDYNTCVNLVIQTYKRLGLPCPSKDYFEQAYNILTPKELMHTFAAIFEGKIIGTRMELVCGGNIYDWYAGADDSQSNKYPNDFIPYNIILWGKDNGYKRFDFGGAGKPDVPYGVREHKQKFGGELVNFGRYELVHKPLLMLIGRTAFPIYKFMKRLVK